MIRRTYSFIGRHLAGILLWALAWSAGAHALVTVGRVVGIRADAWPAVAAFIAFLVVTAVAWEEHTSIVQLAFADGWLHASRATALQAAVLSHADRLGLGVCAAIRMGLPWSVRTRPGPDGPLWLHGEPTPRGYLLLIAGRGGPVDVSVEEAIKAVEAEVRVRPEANAPNTHLVIGTNHTSLANEEA